MVPTALTKADNPVVLWQSNPQIILDQIWRTKNSSSGRRMTRIISCDWSILGHRLEDTPVELWVIFHVVIIKHC